MLQVALIQMKIGLNKYENLSNALKLIKTAKEKGAELVVLPECFNSPYGTGFFKDFAEKIPAGNTCHVLSTAAKDNDIFILGGSIPELDASSGRDHFYNTCTVWGPNGELLAKHRKIHLFDIDIPGQLTFRESETLAAGNSLNTFQIKGWKIGIGICYDLRFQEMAALYRKSGCHLLLYPGAFNMATGPLHWELLLRARAVENQVYVAGIAPARDQTASYVSYGNTMLVDPWGVVKCRADEIEEILDATLDLTVIEKVRQQIPVFKQKRLDLYDTIAKIW